MKIFKPLSCLTLTLLLLCSVWASAQHATVVYNYERNYFNENQPLPAETNMIFSGGIPGDVNIVEVELYRGGDDKKKNPLYTATWKRPHGNQMDVFSTPVNYKLHSGNSYDVRLNYFRSLTEAEREYLKTRLFQTLDAYILSSLEVNKRNIRMLKPSKRIMLDLNSIVEDALSVYRSRSEVGFDGFSDVVKNQLRQIEDADLSRGKFLSIADKKRNAKAMYANKLLEDLMKVVRNETEQYLNSDLMLISDTKMVDDYSVEKTPGSLSLNVGYGGVHFAGGFNDLDYGSAPFVGVSVPFGRKAFSRFLGNSSLSIGAMVTNMENAAGEEVTGPIIKRPSYVALGYKLFKFVRLNAGASFTEVAGSNGDGLSNVSVRPFVGISAEVNLSISFGDK